MASLSILESWKAQVLRDLNPFADPGTTIAISEVGRALEISWSQRAETRSARITGVKEGEVRVECDGSTFGYRSFFASRSMADLRGLAQMTLQARPKRPFVRTKARVPDINSGSSAPAQQEAQDAVTLVASLVGEPKDNLSTMVLMVTGEPGAGKTSVLQEIVRNAAERYIQGETDHLFLYIDAQGRALARFKEALSAELNHLRSFMPVDAVSTATRLGLIVPVIDGFDELLGTGGYDDAFSSLSNFLEELDGSGCIVASARSTYYEQEFVSRAGRASGAGAHLWTQTPIQVCAWGEAEFAEFLEMQETEGEDPYATEEYRRELTRVFSASPELKQKPFFVSTVAKLVRDGVELGAGASLLEEVTGAYIERERKDKLLDRRGKPLLSNAQIRQLYAELAEEMWNQETRELDRQTIREIAELVALSGHIEGDAGRVVVERLPYMAFLRSGSRVGSVAFEHENFFSLFFAGRLAERLDAESIPIAPLLARSLLSDDVAEMTQARCTHWRAADFSAFAGRLSKACQMPSLKAETVRENAGTLAMSFMRGYPELISSASPVFDHLVFPGGSLQGCKLTSVRFVDCEFRRVNFVQCQLLECEVTNSVFSEVRVAVETTRLDIGDEVTLADFLGLQVLSSGVLSTVFDPVEIEEALVRIGALKGAQASARRQVDKEVVRLLEVLTRAYGRANPITVEDPRLSVLRHSSSWEKVERLLLKHGLVSKETRQTKGPTKTFLRRQVDVADLMAGLNLEARVPDRVKEFWNEVEARF